MTKSIWKPMFIVASLLLLASCKDDKEDDKGTEKIVSSSKIYYMLEEGESRQIPLPSDIKYYEDKLEIDAPSFKMTIDKENKVMNITATEKGVNNKELRIAGTDSIHYIYTEVAVFKDTDLILYPFHCFEQEDNQIYIKKGEAIALNFVNGKEPFAATASNGNIGRCEITKYTGLKPLMRSTPPPLIFTFLPESEVNQKWSLRISALEKGDTELTIKDASNKETKIKLTVE